MGTGFGVQGLGSRVWGSGFRVKDLGCGVGFWGPTVHGVPRIVHDFVDLVCPLLIHRSGLEMWGPFAILTDIALLTDIRITCTQDG